MIEAKLLKKQGMKQFEIAQALGVSERSIYNYLNDCVFVGKPKQGRKKGSKKLEEFCSYIDKQLEENINLNCELLYEDLQKKGFTGGKTILRKYVHDKSKELETLSVCRYETLLGEQAQVDWKELGAFMDKGIMRKRYGFVMKLGYSRKSYIEFTESMEQGVLFACHKRAFEYFGGVPQKILYDNMKTAFLCNKGTKEWFPHPKMLRFATHYGYSPRRCRVRRAKTKGKVEREIRTLEQNFLPRIDDLFNMTTEELNERVLSWLKDFDKKKLQEFNQSRNERFIEEKDTLQGLPLNDFDYRHEHTLNVKRDGYFVFRKNEFSAPAKYIGKKLIGKRDPDQHTMSIYNEDHFLIREIKLPRDSHGLKYELAKDRAEFYERWEKERDWEQAQMDKKSRSRKKKSEPKSCSESSKDLLTKADQIEGGLNERSKTQPIKRTA